MSSEAGVVADGVVDISTVKVGDRLVADGGFTCIFPAQVCTVQEHDGRLYVPCFGSDCENLGETGTQNSKHFLDGQTDDDGRLVGFAREIPKVTIEELLNTNIDYMRQGLRAGAFPIVDDKRVSWGAWFQHLCECFGIVAKAEGAQ